MRRLAYIVCAGICVCAAVVVSTAERVIDVFTEAIDWMLGILPVEAPSFAFPDERISNEGFGGFADPHVERHEAGMARRAACRGI
jgi:hypothetical protein